MNESGTNMKLALVLLIALLLAPLTALMNFQCLELNEK